MTAETTTSCLTSFSLFVQNTFAQNKLIAQSRNYLSSLWVCTGLQGVSRAYGGEQGSDEAKDNYHSTIYTHAQCDFTYTRMHSKSVTPRGAGPGQSRTLRLYPV